MKKLVFDKDKCASHQICVTLAPEVFELDKDSVPGEEPWRSGRKLL
jgi:ferredoxin